MGKINLSKRVLAYCVIIIVYLIAVKIQQMVITARRQAIIVSASSEWSQKGKPVEVKIIKSHDVKQYIKTTVSSTGEAFIYQGFVSKSIQQKLASGQDLYWVKQVGRLEVGDPVYGKVVSVGQEPDIINGMYQVQVKFDKEIPQDVNMVVARIHYDTIRHSINIPIESFDMKDGSFFGWVVRDGKAHQVELFISQRNGYGAIVKKGLNEGDAFIVRGMTFLKENDLVHIMKSEE